MKAFKPILLLLALAGLSIAQDTPGPEVDVSGNLVTSETSLPQAGLSGQASLSGDEWVAILELVLASTRDQN